MGVGFDCPNHLSHRIDLWFENPGDGGEPSTEKERGEPFRRRKLFAHGDELESLTVAQADNEPMELRDCGAFWLVDGVLYECLFRCGAW